MKQCRPGLFNVQRGSRTFYAQITATTAEQRLTSWKRPVCSSENVIPAIALPF